MPYCHSCGTQLNESAKFCPACGAAYQGTQQTVQASPPTATPPPHPHHTQSAPQTQSSPVQQNVVIMGKAKSVGVAFILAFFFGPLGLLYASVVGGIVMFFVGLLSFLVMPLIGYILVHIGCIIWACVAADQANRSMVNKGNALINNQFQR